MSTNPADKEREMQAATSPILPPDVAAYIHQAAVELAAEQGFAPADEDAMLAWLRDNAKAIGERANALQWELLAKLTRNGAMRRVGAILAAEVWADAQSKEIRRRANRRIAEAID